MRVRHWMQPDPVTVPGDTLVSEAKRLLSESGLHALPVIDDGRLRGLVTRAHLLRAGHFVLRTQSPAEFNYFVTRLRVKDIMVRNPATVQADDTMEHCLRKGRELGVAQFPVLDGALVVGVISANEIFQLAAFCIGAWERRTTVTLAPLRLAHGVLGRVTGAAEAAGAALHAVYAAGRGEPAAQAGERKKVVLHFDAADPAAVVRALEDVGFAVLESFQLAALEAETQPGDE
jgi:acetoin utilization protein AcuB